MKKTDADAPALSRAGAIGSIRSIILFIVATVPLVVSFRGADAFRRPKDLVFYALVGILLIAIGVKGADLGGRLRRHRPELWMIGALVLWVGLTVVVSATPYQVGSGTFLHVVASAVFFLAVLAVAPDLGLSSLWFGIVPAVINAALCSLQAFRIWQPFTFGEEVPRRLTYSALMGNPNDLGVFLLAPSLAALAVSVISPRWRWPAAAAAALGVLGIAASQTMTALGALLAALFVFVFRLRRGRVIGLMFVGFALVTSMIYAPIRNRVGFTVASVRSGAFDAALSSRMVPFAAAARLGMRNPIAGVGAGGFPYYYFTEKVATERALVLPPNPTSYGEVHNDFLETFAETGLPGLLLMFLAFVRIAALSRSEAATDRERFVRLFSLPFAVGVAGLALAQFPFQLTAPTVSHAFFAALLVSWRSGTTNEPSE
jgi:O-antigen ligase